MGAAQAPAPAKTGPFLPNAGAQCIPVDKLENGTLAFPASACVLLGLGCNPGPKRTSSAEPPGRRATSWRHSAPPRGQLPCRVPDLSRQGLKPEHHWQADKVCRKGSSWVPPPGAPSSNPLFQLALKSGTQTSPRGRSRGVCLRGGGGAHRECPPALPQSPSASRPSCPPAVRARRARRSPANSWIGSWESGRPLLSPPRGPEKGERRAAWLSGFGWLQLRLASSRRETGALAFPGSPGPLPGPMARRAQRPAPRLGPGEEARRGGRPGHCAAGAGSRGCARPAPEPGKLERGAPAPTRTLRDRESRPLPAGPRGSELRTGVPTRLQGHRLAVRGERRGGPFIRNTEQSAASARLGTHAPARPHAPRSRPGCSPES